MPVGFISEMSAQPIHGGGITLRRIVGEDLERFDWIAKTLHYPGASWPEYAAPCHSHCYPWWKLESALRPFLRCTLANRIAYHPVTRAAFARSVARRLLRAQPDLLKSRILVCPQAEITVLVLEELQKISRIHYVTWVMDDHRLKWHHNAWEYPAGFEPRMRRHLVEAEQVHVISPALRDFYKSRFGVDSTVLCAPAATNPPHAGRAISGNCLKLVYFGSLGPWQNDAMELLIPFLGRRQVSLDVFSPNPDAIPSGIKSAGAILRPGVAARDVVFLYSQYDAVVLPISFTTERKNMSCFNIATKFSECLAAGIPTLIIGPPDAIMVKMAAGSRAGVIVDCADPEAMAQALVTLRDPVKSSEVVQAALQLARSEFSSAVMEARFGSSRSFLFNHEGAHV